jgi:hypothetical protein
MPAPWHRSQGGLLDPTQRPRFSSRRVLWAVVHTPPTLDMQQNLGCLARRQDRAPASGPLQSLPANPRSIGLLAGSARVDPPPVPPVDEKTGLSGRRHWGGPGTSRGDTPSRPPTGQCCRRIGSSVQVSSASFPFRQGSGMVTSPNRGAFRPISILTGLLWDESYHHPGGHTPRWVRLVLSGRGTVTIFGLFLTDGLPRRSILRVRFIEPTGSMHPCCAPGKRAHTLVGEDACWNDDRALVHVSRHEVCGTEDQGSRARKSVQRE